MVRAALTAFPRPLMRFPAFPALCDALHFLFRLNAALGHSLGLGITPQRVTINPTQFCDLPCTDILLSSLGNPIVLFTFVVFRCRVHRPFVHCLIITVTVCTDHGPNVYIPVSVRYLALISTSCHYMLGKP